jgi:hypothetical protein
MEFLNKYFKPKPKYKAPNFEPIDNQTRLRIEDATVYGTNHKSREVLSVDGAHLAHALKADSENTGKGWLQREETSKIVGRILKGFLHVSDTINQENKSYSFEKHGLLKNEITPKMFLGKFPDKYSEAEAEIFILDTLFGDKDRCAITSHNIKFYEDGTFTLFDFEYAFQFYWQFHTFENRAKGHHSRTVNKIIYQKALDKIRNLLNFYETKDGYELLMAIFKTSKIPIKQIFLFDEVANFTRQTTEDFFYKTFIRRLKLLKLRLKVKTLL